MPSDSFYEKVDENIAERVHLLPAWFTEAMFSRSGHFALFLEGGHILGAHKIENVHMDAAGSIWLDLLLFPQIDANRLMPQVGGQRIQGAVSTQSHATVQARAITAVIDLGEVKVQ